MNLFVESYGGVGCGNIGSASNCGACLGPSNMPPGYHFCVITHCGIGIQRRPVLSLNTFSGHHSGPGR
eukprot:scaffold399847_cov17-Prasinocladus_malaysianus.AAC.1